MTIFTNIVGGCLQGARYAPRIPSQSCADNILANAKCFRPFNNGLGLSVKLKKFIPAGVSGLLAINSPSAIFGRIAFVVVDAVNRVLWAWLFSHVGIKVLKRIKPAVTDGNSTQPVAFKRLLVWVVAASFHAFPRCIFNGSSHAVPKQSLFVQFCLNTTTASCISALNIFPTIRAIVSAIAQTMPERSFVFDVSKTRYRKPPKLLPGNVFKMMGSFTAIMIISHAVYLRLINGLVRALIGFQRPLTPAHYTTAEVAL